jgi:hypothetical protein
MDDNPFDQDWVQGQNAVNTFRVHDSVHHQ